MVDLRPSAAVLGTQIALASAIERHAVAATAHDATTQDLLLRIAESPGGQTRAVDLCRQLQLSAGYVSKRVDRAVDAGLVERRPDPADRRAQTLTLSPHGQAVVDDFRPRLETVLEQVVMDTLTPAERRTLVDLLDRIAAACLTLIEE